MSLRESLFLQDKDGGLYTYADTGDYRFCLY